MQTHADEGTTHGGEPPRRRAATPALGDGLGYRAGGQLSESRADGHEAARLLNLQRVAGNEAVTRMLAASRAARLPVQRGVGTQLIDVFKSDETLVKEADAGDVDAIKAISDYGALTDERRVKYLGLVLGQGDLGWRDRRALVHLWSTFGNVYSAAKNNADMWERSVKADGDELVKIGEFAAKPMQFKIDIINLAQRILAANQVEIERQFSRLGADENGQVKGELGEVDVKRLEAQQKAAAQVLAAEDYRRGLRATVVGYAPPPPDSALGETTKDLRVPVTLAMVLDGVVTPNQPPDEGAPPLEQVKHSYALAGAIMKGLYAQWPALYAAGVATEPGPSGTRPQGDKLESVASGSPAEARKALLDALKRVKANIVDAGPKVRGDPDLPFEMVPLHRRLTSGQDKGSLDWSTSPYKPVVEWAVRDYNEGQALQSLGLTTLAAAAFIFAEFATGGLATFALVLGAAASATAAGGAIDKAMSLAAVEDTSLSSDDRLIEEGQASAAMIDAYLQTIFAVIDLAAAAKAIGTAAKGASGLSDLDKLPRAEAAARVERSIDEVGAAATLRLSGKSADELIAIVGAEGRLAEALRLVPTGKIATATGVASEEALARAGKAANVLADDWAKLETVEARVSWLEARLNEELVKAGAPPIRVVPGPTGGAMGSLQFNPYQYEVGIPVGYFLNARTAEQIATLTALAYHEARHAEQWFLVARRLAYMGRPEAEIVTRTGLSEKIVKDAMARPLADGAEAAAADKWLASFATKDGARLRDVAYRDMEAAEAAYKAAKKEYEEAAQRLLADPNAKGDLTALKNQLDDARVLRDATVEQYHLLPEEVDAYGVSNEIMKRAQARGAPKP